MARLLFADMFMNMSLARMPHQFKQLGAEVYGLGFMDRILLQSDSFDHKYPIDGTPRNATFRKITGALSDCCNHARPDFLLTNDETLISVLIKIRENIRASTTALPPNVKQVSDLLEASLISDPRLYQRHYSLLAAKEAGFPIPPHQVATSEADLLPLLQKLTPPYFLKMSLASGGLGVLAVREDTSAEEVLAQVQDSDYPLNDIRHAVLQQPAKGEELTVSFAAHNGKLLGYIVVRPLQKLMENGPSAVIENLYRPHWQEPLAQLVARVGYSGFGGLDVFEHAADGLPSVIEVNFRPTHTTPTSRAIGTDLVELFYNAYTGAAPSGQSVVHQDVTKKLALFPEAILADPQSEYLQTLPLDINWEDYGLNTYITRRLQNFIPPKDDIE